MRAYELYLWLLMINISMNALTYVGFLSDYIAAPGDLTFINQYEELRDINYAESSGNFTDFLQFGDLLKGLILLAKSLIYSVGVPGWLINQFLPGNAWLVNLSVAIMWIPIGHALLQYISKTGYGGLD